MTIDTQEYWEKRLANNLNLRGTGHRAFSEEYNRWLYQAQTDSLDSLLKQHHVTIQGKNILDGGSGSGFFVDFYMPHAAHTLHQRHHWAGYYRCQRESLADTLSTTAVFYL